MVHPTISPNQENSPAFKNRRNASMQNTYGGIMDFNPSGFINMISGGIVQMVDMVEGNHFSVTLANPTRGTIFYSFRNKVQIGLVSGYQRTHEGYGAPDVQFDTGNDSLSHVNLSNGNTYHFNWKQVDLPEVGIVQMLELFTGPPPLQVRRLWQGTVSLFKQEG